MLTHNSPLSVAPLDSETTFEPSSLPHPRLVQERYRMNHLVLGLGLLVVSSATASDRILRVGRYSLVQFGVTGVATV